jgi:hypothetical protein
VVVGLIGHPTLRHELEETSQGPASLELANDVDEVDAGVDAEQQAVVDEREGDGEPLAAADRAGEQEVAARYGEGSNAAFDAIAIEAAVLEATPKECSLIATSRSAAACAVKPARPAMPAL